LLQTNVCIGGELLYRAGIHYDSAAYTCNTIEVYGYGM